MSVAPNWQACMSRNINGGLFALAFAAVIVPRLDAQQCVVGAVQSVLASGQAVVHRYAPMYWFSPGERYFPTLPMFTAFDGINNDNDDLGLVDFADPTEIAPVDSLGRLSWEGVTQYYNKVGYDKTGRAAVFYRVRDLDRGRVRELWRYLKSDEQRWKRFDIAPDDKRILLADSTEFQVIEYYPYYLKDFGLIGHEWDTEIVFVFLPKDAGLAEKFRVLVGGGHTQRVPSNVLVVSGDQAERLQGPDRRPGVLVELGDHSSAIDVRPFGQFQPGHDANWQDHDVWGTRDVQASSGQGALGRYELTMTLPRDGAVRLFPPQRVLSDDSLRLIQGIPSVPNRNDYSLLPAEAFRCLFEAVENGGSVSQIEAWMSLIADQPWSWGFTGFQTLTPTQKDAAVTAMRGWANGNPRSERRVWETPHYTKSPTRIFKQPLFRPVANAMSPGDVFDLLNVWTTVHANRAALVQFGFEVPAFWIPIRVPGYLELPAGWYWRCANVVTDCFGGRTSAAFSAVHTGHYNRAFSWYGRLSYVPRRAEVTGDSTLADFAVGGGLSLVPASLNASRPLKWLRIRLGLSTGATFAGPRLGRVAWELQIALLRGSTKIR